MVAYLLVLLSSVALMLAAVFLARYGLAKRIQPNRGLFVYSDGVKLRSIDPIQVMLALEAHPEFRLDRHMRLAYEGDTEAVQVVARTVHDVFGVPEFTEVGKPGLTVNECYRLINAFCHFVETVKKNISPTPTVPQSTVGPTSFDFNNKTTSDSLPSGSSEGEPVSESVNQSATV